MRKWLFSKLKSFLIAPFIIYLYNLIASPLGYVIPINVFTVMVVALLGIPGLIFLVILFVLIF